MTQLPKGKTLIGCKWVIKVKYNVDGSIERHKAGPVVKGYTQQLGLDYIETYSLVERITTIKTLLDMAVAKGSFIHQLDVNNIFLHSDLNEDVYIVG